MKKIIYSILILSLLGGCSTKKNGITHRTYHRITTWNNTLFNGQEALNEELKSRNSRYRDNFSAILPVEPGNPFVEEKENSLDNFLASSDNNTANLSGELKDNLKNLDAQGAINSLSDAFGKMLGAGNDSKAQGYDKAIEKGKKAIEKHSMLIKGKEYNSMMSEAYLLLARAYYYKRDPFESLNYLNYMNSTLVKNTKKAQVESYMALAQAQSGNSFQANEIYEKLINQKLKKRDAKFISKIYSQFLIDEKRYSEAVKALDVAKKYNKCNTNQARFSFIQGQLSEKLNEKDMARNYYNLAFKKKSTPELEIKSQIALSRLYKKEDSLAYTNRIKFLKGLTKKGLYQSRKNEIYYAMGLTSLKEERNKDAMNYFFASLKEEESDPQIRALVYQEIGDNYFSKPDYVYASAYYDSAISRFFDPAMKRKLTAKNKVLGEVTKKYYLVKKNDSIITVAKMLPEQRNNYYQKYINQLKEKEEKERLQQEKNQRRENNTEFTTESFENTTSAFTMITPNTKGKWYFYNNNLKQVGQSEFRKQWGDRMLEDNWRISNKISNLDDVKTQLSGQSDSKNPRRFEVEYYTENLPKSQSEIDVLKNQRDSVELSLGILYYDQLHDVKSATSTLEHLLSTQPYNEEIKVLAMYNLYRFNQGENQVLAKKYSDIITTQYPDTKYAYAILHPQVNELKTNSSDAILFYENAYQKYKNGNYSEVKDMANQALSKYPKDEIIAKFALLSAFCDAKLGNKEEFEQSLEHIAVLYKDKEEGKKAADLLKFFKDKEKENNKKSVKANDPVIKANVPVSETNSMNLPTLENWQNNDVDIDSID